MLQDSSICLVGNDPIDVVEGQAGLRQGLEALGQQGRAQAAAPVGTEDGDGVDIAFLAANPPLVASLEFGRMTGAVRGMLPRNPLGRSMMKKLRIFAGPEHSHQAQQPKPLEI